VSFVAAVFTAFALALYIVGDAQIALDCSYQESIYQDGSVMYMICLECPRTNHVLGCGTQAALMDSDFFFTENNQSYTSRRAAGLYAAGAAPDSVNHLSDQFYFGQDRKCLRMSV
jgi:hypothetical protein